MIEIIKKDITTVTEGVVAHGVNCQRRMGSGVALAIKRQWPIIFKKYMAQSYGKSMLGRADCISVTPVSFNMFVCNCYTQQFYGPGDRKYASEDAIEESLKKVFSLAHDFELDIYLPKIGAGLGGLDWETEVLPIIERIDTAYNPNKTTYICEWE